MRLEEAKVASQISGDNMGFEHIAENSSSGKHVKDGTESSNEDVIHVRARRGQATNSHSLAERVRSCHHWKSPFSRGKPVQLSWFLRFR